MPQKRHFHVSDQLPASPWDAIRSLRDQMDEFMSSALSNVPSGRGATAWQPDVDISERDDALVLEAEMPGMSKDDIDIEVEDNTLILRGEKKEEREEKDEDRFLYERRYGSFSRSFPLPRTVDPDRIQARFHNGVLTVTMPKTEEKKGKRIQVQDGEEKR